MKNAELTPGERERGRKFFIIFVIFNLIAFPFLSGNVITLIGLNLRIPNTIIGILSSATYISFLFLLIGKLLIRRKGAVKLLSVYYTGRNIVMIPVLILPFLMLRDNRSAAVIVLICSVFAFNILRGIHLTSDNPISAELSGSKARGAFFSRVLIYSYLITILAGALMYFILRRDPSLNGYIVIIGIGIASGIAASRFIPKIPEPKQAAQGFKEPLLQNFLDSMKLRNFRLFYSILFLSFFSVSMFTPFLVVYCKNMYAVSDSGIMLYNLIGNIGAFLMAVLSSYSIDKLGAKPLYFAFTLIGLCNALIICFFPDVEVSRGLFIFIASLFFLHLLGTSGMYNGGRIYFLSIITPAQQLNLGVVYFVILGIGGALGSLTGGFLLDLLLHLLKISSASAFRIYFSIIALLLFILLFLIQHLDNAGAYPIKSAITHILSPRDLRALALLKKLDNTKTIDEEKQIISTLGKTPSVLSIENLISKIHSPSLSIRGSALLAFKDIPFTDEIENILISELKNHPYTTAYIAAELLGEKRSKRGIKPLRDTLVTKDYFLAAKSMIALALIGDRKSIPIIAHIMEKTKNPRLIIHGAKAFELFKETEMLPLLFQKLESKTFPFIRDEILLACAGILGMYEWFYPLYVSFLERGYTGVYLLIDKINDLNNVSEVEKSRLREIVSSIFSKPYDFPLKARIYLQDHPVTAQGKNCTDIFLQYLENKTIAKLERFRFFTAGVMIYYSEADLR